MDIKLNTLYQTTHRAYLAQPIKMHGFDLYAIVEFDGDDKAILCTCWSASQILRMLNTLVRGS